MYSSQDPESNPKTQTPEAEAQCSPIQWSCKQKQYIRYTLKGEYKTTEKVPIFAVVKELLTY